MDDVSYMNYEPKKLKLGLPHPDPVVENASMAAVDPPELWYELKLQVGRCSIYLLVWSVVVVASDALSPPAPRPFFSFLPLGNVTGCLFWFGRIRSDGIRDARLAHAHAPTLCIPTQRQNGSRCSHPVSLQKKPLVGVVRVDNFQTKDL